MLKNFLPHGSWVAATAFSGILLFLALSIYYSTQSLTPLVAQLESATDQRLKKSLLVNRMVMAGNRRALLLSKIAHVTDPFERDQLLMQVYEHGADFVDARSALESLPLDDSEQQLLGEQAELMRRLTPQVEHVVGLLQQEKMQQAHAYLMANVVQQQGMMLSSLAQLGSYQQVRHYQGMMEIRTITEQHRQKIYDAGGVMFVVVLVIALGVVRALSLGERSRQEAHRKLEESHRQLSQSLSELKQSHQVNSDRQYALDQSALVMMTDPQGTITYVNDRYCQVSGYRRAQLLGNNPRLLSSGQQETGFWRQFWEEIQQGEVVRREICNHTRTQRPFWISTTITPLMKQRGEMRGYLAIAFEITDRKRMEDELQQSHEAWRRELEQRHSEISKMAFLASHDALTQLPNQELLLDRIAHAIKRNEEEPEQSGCSLLMLDLLNFREVNEGLGPKVGDQLLVQVAARMKKYLAASSTVARVSGKKFAILRESIGDSAEESSDLIRALLEELHAPFQVMEHLIHLKVAVGVVFFPEDGETTELLINRASMALHQAKEQKLDYLYYQSDLHQLAQRHTLLMHQLRSAVDNGEFELYYQPRISLQSGLMEGAEALIRWNHPERGVVTPNEFIPLLESSGLIHSVGQWVLQQACLQAQQWREEGAGEMVISVNLTVDQLQSKEIVGIVSSALEQAALPPHALELEITESHYMDQLERSLRHLTALREMGVQVAIDDFGTGHSSLAYLLHLPVDTLKIDKCFIDHIPENRQDLFLVETILGIGERLGLKIVAEGVEQEQQLNWLKLAGCDEVQGFLYSHPLPSDSLKQWMKDHFGFSQTVSTSV